MRARTLCRNVILVAIAGAAGVATVPVTNAAEGIAINTPFNEWRQAWTRLAKEGPIGSAFEVKVLKTYEATGPRVIDPKPGDLFVYINTGGQNWGLPTRPDETNTNEFSRVNVVDARTKKVLGSGEMRDAPGRLHTSAVSPDGRFAYVPAGNGDDAVLFKVDALTLEPLKMLDIGGTIHHIQVFQDRYLMIDTFSMKESTGSKKRAIMLLDPETDQIVGGIKSDDMGGNQYVAFTDPKQEFIYSLMEPLKGGAGSKEYMAGAIGGVNPYWVAKIDPKDWSVVAEYPYPGLRSDWIQFSADGNFMYVDGSVDDSISKIDLTTGEMVWRNYTGVGPYGIELSADGTQVWVTDKGESWKGHSGRTITVVDAEKGTWLDTIMHDGRGTDHLTLSPDGKEVWASANDSGALVVMNAADHSVTDRIYMPLYGDPHGVVFVAYGADGKGRVVADQGDFHGGIDPRNGKPLQ